MQSIIVILWIFGTKRNSISIPDYFHIYTLVTAALQVDYEDLIIEMRLAHGLSIVYYYFSLIRHKYTLLPKQHALITI